MEKKPLNIFLDLTKAFDTIDHSLLFQKLCHNGIRNTALKLCKDYLTNREQYVQFGESFSDKLKITTGVPQGSILGPFPFFNLYK